MSEKNYSSVNIYDREFQIKCPIDKDIELQHSAIFLDKKMREIHKAHNTLSVDRVAIMAALNICHEYLLLKKSNTEKLAVHAEKIQNLNNKIEAAIITEE